MLFPVGEVGVGSQWSRVTRTVEDYTTRRAVIAAAAVYWLVLAAAALYMDTAHYGGLTYAETSIPDHPAILVAFAIGVLPAMWMPITLERPSQLLYWGLYMIVYVPAAVIPYLTHDSVGRFLPLSLTLLVAMGAIQLSYLLPLVDFPRLSLSPRLFWGLAVAGTVVLLGILVSLVGVRFDVVGLGSIYETRAWFAAQVDRLGPIGQRLAIYSLQWLNLIVFPLLYAIALTRRKPIFAVAALAGFLYVYALTGFKITLFIVLGMPALALVLHRRGRGFAGYAFAAVLSVAFAAFLAHLSVGSVRLFSILRRLLLGPGFWMGNYYDWFVLRNNPIILLSDRAFAMTTYPYAEHHASIFDTFYIPQVADVNVSVSFWANGIARFGLFGILLFTGLFAGGAYLYDSISQHLDLRLATLWLTGYVIIVTNSDLITAMITNGLALFLILAYLYSGVGRPDRAEGRTSTLAGIRDWVR